MASQMFIGGELTDAASGATFTAFSPATGERIGEVPDGDRADAQRALEAAQRAFPAWSEGTPFERARYMHRIGEICERRKDELARLLTLDQGKPLQQSPTTRSTS